MDDFFPLYFPSEKNKIDKEKVSTLYDFIVERVKSLQGDLQVILVDHADIDKFKKFEIHNWWGADDNLIPRNWYEGSKEEF